MNCVINRDGRLIGTNTDGMGFLDSLAAGDGLRAGRASGAWSSAQAGRPGQWCSASAEAGAARCGRGGPSARRGGGRGRAGRGAGPGRDRPRGRRRRSGRERDPGRDACDEYRRSSPPRPLGRGQVVVDLVYEPAETPIGCGPRRHAGAVVLGGLGMLVHQAAAAARSLDRPRPAPRGHVGGRHCGPAGSRASAVSWPDRPRGRSAGRHRRARRPPRRAALARSRRAPSGWPGATPAACRWPPRSATSPSTSGGFVHPAEAGGALGHPRRRVHGHAGGALERSGGGDGHGHLDHGLRPSPRGVGELSDLAVGNVDE